MPELSLSLEVSTGTLNSGDSFESNTFDHAAVVTAHRSRSDGYDMRLYHTLYGPVTFTLRNPNTATANIRAIAQQEYVAVAVDGRFRLIYGNLAHQVTPFGSPSAPSGITTNMPVTFGSALLPAPGWPLERIDIRDVDTNEYPESMSVRRRARNQNPRSGYRLSWYHLTPDDWYAIRAHQHAMRGGAGAFSAPSWLGGAATYRYVSLPTLRQSSRLGYEADAAIEELVA